VVVRYPLRCTGCGANIRLRLQVGHDKNHPFAFECRQCHQVIRGVHVLGKPPKTYLRELAGAKKESADPDPDQSVTLSPDFLWDGDPSPNAFSPFLHTFNRLGAELAMAQIARARMFTQIATEIAPPLQQAIRNYESGDDRRLVAILREHVGDPPGDTPAGRLQALHRLAVVAMSPVAASPPHIRVMTQFHQLPIRASRHNPKAYERLLQESRDKGLVAELELTNLKLIPRIYDLRSEVLPVLVDWDVRHPEVDIPPHLLFGRVGRFDEAKSLYVDAYEAVMRSLTAITAVCNVLSRGNHGAYPAYPERSIRRAKSMMDFHRQNHAPKLSLLAGIAVLRGWPGGALEPNLRNAIGHNSASLDTLGERLSDPASRKGGTVTLSYANFLVRVLRAVNAAHEANQILRLVRAQELSLP
jgi:hypothetical protein